MRPVWIEHTTSRYSDEVWIFSLALSQLSYVRCYDETVLSLSHMSGRLLKKRRIIVAYDSGKWSLEG